MDIINPTSTRPWTAGGGCRGISSSIQPGFRSDIVHLSSHLVGSQNSYAPEQPASGEDFETFGDDQALGELGFVIGPRLAQMVGGFLVRLRACE